MTKRSGRSKEKSRFALRLSGEMIRDLALSSTILLATVITSSLWAKAFAFGDAGLVLGLAPLLGFISGSGTLKALGKNELLFRMLASGLLLVGFTMWIVNQAPTSLGAFLHGLIAGPVDLVSIGLPLASQRGTLDAPVLVCWILGFSSASVVRLVKRPMRYLVPILLLGYGLAYAGTSSVQGDVVWPGILLVTLVLLAYIVSNVSTGGRDPGGRFEQQDLDNLLRVRARRGAKASVGILVLVALVAVFPFSARTSPASLQRLASKHELFVANPVDSILSEGYVDGRPSVHSVFRATFGSASSGYVALATLGSYNGVDWNLVGNSFRPSGELVPGSSTAGVDGSESVVTQRYRVIGSDPMPWLPFVGQPHSVSGLAMSYSERDGMVVPDNYLSSGESFQVVSRLDGPQLSGVPDNPGNVVPQYLDYPSNETPYLAQMKRSLASEYGLSSASPVELLTRLADEFRVGYELVPLEGAAVASVSVDQADTLFGDAAHAAVVDHSATSVQYATVLALLARYLGVPSRLVVGFDLNPQGSKVAAALKAGSYTLSTSELQAWDEVFIPGVGWQILNPNPRRVGTPIQQAFSAASHTPPTTLPPTNVTPSLVGHAIAPPVNLHLPKPARPVSTLLVIFGVVVLGLAIVIPFPMLYLWILRRLRYRRLSRISEPSAEVVATWSAAIATLGMYGMYDTFSATGKELVELSTHQFGETVGCALDSLRLPGERAIYDLRYDVDELTARETIETLGALDRALMESLQLGGRYRAGLRLLFSPRRLRRGSSIATQEGGDGRWTRWFKSTRIKVR
ncbi:MAG: transglutaminase-like domain-containing protein [Ferrimicrobium sp.]